MKPHLMMLGCALMVLSCCTSSLKMPQPLEAGTAAPPFTLTSTTAGPVSLSDFSGRLVLLNFWSTTCPPCLEELPVLATLDRDYQDEVLAVVTVCVYSSAREIEETLDRSGVDLLVLVDEECQICSAYHIGGLPTTYLIDGNSTIRQSWLGYGKNMEETFRAGIEQLVGQQ
jgi:peroxiredoxin